jgi:hypothetical protein
VFNRAEADAEAARCRLPVCGRVVVLRLPRGAEDLLLLETASTPQGDAALALALPGRLCRAADGEPIDWGGLPAPDLDVLLLRLRQALFGDRVRADVACPTSGCGRRIDIDFSIEDLLAHQAPRAAAGRRGGRSPQPAAEPYWFRLAREKADGEGSEVLFRLPTAADQLAVADDAAAADALARRCIRPPTLPARLRRRVEAAMEAMAPALSCDLQGLCPDCGKAITVQFDCRWFCLTELRRRAAFVYQDVDVLARRYHWPESEILALPTARRTAYAELARRVGEV